ncbi:hypothetical protein L6164_018454 [Bauhinia variegata]|nr:hypothetical protein L6164_018454 [Bauhinia variegata]
MQTVWMQVLERFRPEYLVEEEQTQAVLNMLPPPVKYKSQAGCDDDECVICLEDFVDGEPCRVFPVCKHNFHLDCIDRWLKNGQANCPICRQCVVDACART